MAPRIMTRGAGVVGGGTALGTSSSAGALAADGLTSGQETFHRQFATAQSPVSLTNQVLQFAYFTAAKGFTSGQVRMFSGGTAAGATPTLVRAGLYSIAANGDGTLVAAIANDTTLFASTNTVYIRSWTTPYQMVIGQRYALALLCVTGATAPSIPGAPLMGGITAIGGSEGGMSPRLTGLITAQADLPASFLSASVGSLGARFYAAIIP